MPKRIEDIVKRELELSDPRDPLMCLGISGKLLHVAEVMDNVRWDARCAQIKGSGSDYRQARISVNKRKALYNEAVKIIAEDKRYVPYSDSKHNFFDIAERLSSGAPVSSQEADFAAGIFAQYNVLYLDCYGRIRNAIENIPIF